MSKQSLATVTRSKDYSSVSILVNNQMNEKFAYYKLYNDEDDFDFFFDFNCGLFSVYCPRDKFDFVIKSKTLDDGQKWYDTMYYYLFINESNGLWKYKGYGKRDGVLSETDPAFSVRRSCPGWYITNNYVSNGLYLLRWNLNQDNYLLSWSIEKMYT